MGRAQVMRRVVLPRAALNVVPPTAGEFTNLIKGTSLLSTISITEMTRVAQQVVAVTFRPIEAYLAITSRPSPVPTSLRAAFDFFNRKSKTQRPIRGWAAVANLNRHCQRRDEPRRFALTEVWHVRNGSIALIQRCPRHVWSTASFGNAGSALMALRRT